MRMFVVVSLENKLHFIFSKSCYKRNTTRIKSRLVSDFQNCPNYVSVLKRKPTELLWMNQLTGHLSLLFLKGSRDWRNMLFSNKKIAAHRKALKWQTTETMTILTTKTMQLNFYLQAIVISFQRFCLRAFVYVNKIQLLTLHMRNHEMCIWDLMDEFHVVRLFLLECLSARENHPNRN